MRRRRWIIALSLVAALAMVAAACGDDDEPQATTPPATTAQPTPTTAQPEPTTAAPPECVWEAGDAWDDCAPPEWDTILEAARSEGPVVVGGFPFLGDAMKEAFEADTGLTLEWFGAGGGEVSARLEQEVRAGSLTIDLILGGGTEVETLHPDGLLANIGEQMILPSVQDGPWWRDGERRWYDDDKSYLLEGSGWVFGYIVVNADEIDPASITSWQDLLKPEFSGKIVAYDPVAQGPGQGAAVGMVGDPNGLGLDYVVQLFTTQDVQFSQDNTQVVELVARGTRPVGLFALQSQIERFKGEGFNLEVVIPDDWAGYTTSGFSVIKGGVNPPHPNAAQVYLNWYASPAGQAVYQRILLASSNRTDVDKSEIPWYVVPQEGKVYWEDSDETFRTQVRPGIVQTIVDALGGR